MKLVTLRVDETTLALLDKLADGHLPPLDRSGLIRELIWRAADRAERRKLARWGREVEVARRAKLAGLGARRTPTVRMEYSCGQCGLVRAEYDDPCAGCGSLDVTLRAVPVELGVAVATGEPGGSPPPQTGA